MLSVLANIISLSNQTISLSSNFSSPLRETKWSTKSTSGAFGPLVFARSL